MMAAEEMMAELRRVLGEQLGLVREDVFQLVRDAMEPFITGLEVRADKAEAALKYLQASDVKGLMVVNGQTARTMQVSSEHYEVCQRHHGNGPVWPCPVCFLVLHYTQPAATFGFKLAEHFALLHERMGGEVPPGLAELVQEARKTLGVVSPASISERIAKHVVQAPFTGGGARG